jgi:predicted nucleotidyltransferase
MKKRLEIAKKVISEEVEKAGFNLVKIILFGSRVRGDYTEESDWDFLVILDRDITFSELKKLTGRIQLRLAAFNLPNDLILRGLNQFNQSKKVVGNISYYADKEGIVI